MHEQRQRSQARVRLEALLAHRGEWLWVAGRELPLKYRERKEQLELLGTRERKKMKRQLLEYRRWEGILVVKKRKKKKKLKILALD